MGQKKKHFEDRMFKNLQNWEKHKLDQETPCQIFTKKTIPSHIIVTLIKPKGKEKILRVAREKQYIILKETTTSVIIPLP